MAGRDTGESRKRLSGPEAAPYLGFARKLMGMLKEQMAFNKLQQLSWTKDFANGVRITVASVFGQDEIRITVPTITSETHYGKQEKPSGSRLIIAINYYDVGIPNASNTAWIVEPNRSVCLWEPGRGVTDVIAKNRGSNFATGISYDGNVVSMAYSPDGVSMQAARWVRGKGPEIIFNASGMVASQSQGISADGGTICGFSYSATVPVKPFKWKRSTGIVELSPVPGDLTSICYGISSDGNVIVGRSLDSLNNGEACYWKGKSTTAIKINSVPGYADGSYAYDANSDGSVIVGVSWDNFTGTGMGFRWTQKTGSIPIGIPQGFTASLPYVVSDDGNVIGGTVYSVNDGSSQAFRWDEKNGIVLLPGAFGENFGGMTQDGSIVVGETFTPAHLENPCMWKKNGEKIDLDMSGIAPAQFNFGHAERAVFADPEYIVKNAI